MENINAKTYPLKKKKKNCIILNNKVIINYTSICIYYSFKHNIKGSTYYHVTMLEYYVIFYFLFNFLISRNSY